MHKDIQKLLLVILFCEYMSIAFMSQKDTRVKNKFVTKKVNKMWKTRIKNQSPAVSKTKQITYSLIMHEK